MCSVSVVKTRDCSFVYPKVLHVIRNLKHYFEGSGETKSDSECVLCVIRNEWMFNVAFQLLASNIT